MPYERIPESKMTLAARIKHWCLATDTAENIGPSELHDTIREVVSVGVSNAKTATHLTEPDSKAEQVRYHAYMEGANKAIAAFEKITGDSI